MSQQMSVTQALAELKLLRKRFTTVLEGAQFITVKTKTRQLDVEAFGRNATASYQSYRDLLARYNRIKAAIVASNATAKVAIGGKEYKIAAAVERKRSIDQERVCLQLMRQQYKMANDDFERHQRAQQERLDRLMMQELGKDNKTNVDVVNGLSAAFLKENTAVLVDPLKLEERIKEYSKELEDFETNVDWVLSESNGRITLTV